jgi:hypothetical protein
MERTYHYMGYETSYPIVMPPAFHIIDQTTELTTEDVMSAALGEIDVRPLRICQKVTSVVVAGAVRASLV